MKQHLNKSISLLLALLLCVGLLAVPARAEEASGKCGDNLTWTLVDGVFTVSGSGAMYDYTERNLPPWYEHAEMIQRLVVADGVTTMGNMAFYQCGNMTVASLPASVTVLGDLAFAECTSLTQITLAGVKEIGFSCFYACESLKNIMLPDGLRVIGDQAFYRCESLAGITIPASVTELGNSAFSYCTDLVYVNILAPLTVLPYWSFYGCSLLRDVTLPETIETVEEKAFAACDNLFYVECGSSEQVKEEISEQLQQKGPTPADDADVSYEQTENSTITTKTDPVEGTTVDATVTDGSGWEEVVQSVGSTMDAGFTPSVEVEMQDDLVVPEGALADLSDRDVVVTIHTSENVDWKVILKDQTGETLSGGQNLSIGISPNSSDKYADTIGDAKSYIVQMGNTSLNSTVLLPLGRDAARQNATLYVIDGGKLRKLASVIVDDDGKAAFALAGTVDCKYLVALNVQNISQDEVIIPEKLAPEYGIDYTYGATLTDSQGNQYVLTGRVNKLGFGIGTLTLIVVGILVGSMILVGIVMMLWNKQQKQKYAQYRRRK